MTNEPTNHLNAGAARAAASVLAGDPAGAGAAEYAIPGAAAGLASAGGAELAADAERQNPLLRHCGGGAGSGLGLCGHAVAGARDLLCPRRVRHGDVPDAPGGGRRSAGVYVFSLLERAALVLVGHAAFRLGDGAGGAGSRSAGPGFRLVCLSLEDQRGLFLDHDPGPDLCRYAAVLSQRDRVWRQQRLHRFYYAAGFSGHRHRHPRQPVYGHGFAAVADAVAGRGAGAE